MKRCQQFARRNDYFLKCDIRKYFETIDHEVLKNLLRRIIKDQRLLDLLDKIIDHVVPDNPLGKGLPIGNLTSQHFANLYLGELDHYLKERLVQAIIQRQRETAGQITAEPPRLVAPLRGAKTVAAPLFWLYVDYRSFSSYFAHNLGFTAL